MGVKSILQMGNNFCWWYLFFQLPITKKSDYILTVDKVPSCNLIFSRGLR